MNLNFATFMARLREPEPAPPWSLALALGLVGVYLIVHVLLAPLLVSGLGLLLTGETTVSSLGVINPATTNLALLLAALLSIWVVWWVLRRHLAGGSVLAALRLDAAQDTIWLVLLFSLGVAVVVDFVPLAFERIGLPFHLRGLEAAPNTAWVVAALYTLVVGPLADGILLQGVVFPALAARFTNLPAILLTGLVFMLLQAIDNPSDAALWIEALLAGSYLAGVRAHQKSTRAAIIAGFMFGLFAMFKVMRLYW